MPLPHLFQQGSNNTSLRNIGDAFGKFISERQQLAGQASAWLISNGSRTLGWFKKQRVLEWLKQPHVWKMILAQAITFASVVVLLSGVGFGGMGIGGGTLAAAFQSWAYGGFTPAISLFATLQSMGMTGTLMPVIIGIAVASAVLVAVVMWATGIGREDVGSNDVGRKDE